VEQMVCAKCNESVRSILSLFITFGDGNLTVEEKKILFPLTLHVICNWEMFTFDTFQLAMKLTRRLATWVEPSIMNIPVLSETQPVNSSSVVKKWIQLIGEIVHRKAETPSKEEIASNAVVSQFTQATVRKASNANYEASEKAQNQEEEKSKGKSRRASSTQRSMKRRSSLLLQSAAMTAARGLPSRRFCVVAQGQESSKTWKEVLLSPGFEFLLPEEEDGAMYYGDTDEEELTEEETDNEETVPNAPVVPNPLDLLLETPELQKKAAEIEKEEKEKMQNNEKIIKNHKNLLQQTCKRNKKKLINRQFLRTKLWPRMKKKIIYPQM